MAYQEAVALKRQEELIREEEAAGLAEIELKAKRSAAEKEKRAKKKQVIFNPIVLSFAIFLRFFLCNVGDSVVLILHCHV